MNEEVYQHQPVLLDEVLAGLNLQADKIYVDGTFGRGGHSRAILERLGPQGRLFTFDKDPEAIAHARQQFADDKRFTIVHSSFIHLQQQLEQANIFGKVSGILLDLGVSSPQLDDPDRGFSFMREGKLDMRMDTTQGLDAASWLAQVEEQELANVLWEYGEERFSRRIAKAIVKARSESAITTTIQLAEIISHALPKFTKGKHPATRSFLAIRIAINHELQELEKVLSQAMNALAPGGRLAVISFHSLEDRLVKHFIRHQEQGEALPPGLPVKHSSHLATLKRVGSAIKPSEAEMARNPRARSAVLRIAEKTS